MARILQKGLTSSEYPPSEKKLAKGDDDTPTQRTHSEVSFRDMIDVSDYTTARVNYNNH